MAEKRPSKKAAARGRGGSGDAGSGDDTTHDDHGNDAETYDMSGDTETGEVKTALVAMNGQAPRAVTYEVVDGMAVVEADIVLGTVEEVEEISDIFKAEQRGELESGVIIDGSQYRWPNCTVPYTIDSSLPNQSRVTDAIQHWEDNTNFSFVLRTAANASQYPDYVTFRPAGGCSSSVGKRGGQQFVNLSSACSTGNAIHEIGHTIGLWHEQSREDRDSFVTIHFENIQPGKEHNFNQHITDGDDVGPYDYGSIMHYPRKAFSSNGLDTIVPINPSSASIGQRTALSAGDIAAANSMCGPVLTIKEVAKEFVETTKERFPETIKERVKEMIETTKEFTPETIKERIPEPPVTWVEQIYPGGLGGLVTQPAAKPFVVRTPHRNVLGDQGAAAAAAAAGATGIDGAAVEAALETLSLVVAQAATTQRMASDAYEMLVAALGVDGGR